MSEHLDRLQALVKGRAFRPAHNFGNIKTEPAFMLSARDKLAPGVVREWASQAVRHGTAHSKVIAALTIADDMQQWQELNPALVKVCG